SRELPGRGSSTPIISNGRVFLTSQQAGTDNHLAICLAEKTGEILWSKVIGSDNREVPRNIMATPSPVANGGSVFFLFGNGDLVATDFDGNIRWRRNLESKYDVLGLKYGYSSSPLLHEGRLYICVIRRDRAYRSPMNKTPNDSFLLCVNCSDGETIFKHLRKTDARDESQDAYSSPILFENNGRSEVLLIGADYVTSHDAASGREFWRYEYARQKSTRGRHIPSVVTGGGLVFGVRSRGSGLFAIRPGGSGRLTEEHVAWTFDGPTPDSPTPLYYEGLLYVSDGRRYVSCLDARTGEQKWQGRIDARAPFYASLTGADGKLYTISEAGEFVCMAAGDKQFRILGLVELDEKPTISSIPAANGRLFVRTAKKLYCIGRR
ncbi:MAG: PQQ-binding-like beta-propeller repeat protein, partial [Phycisphaerales bacterium]